MDFGDSSQLKSIGNRFFYECGSLTSIEIPSSVTSIGYDAFRGCYALAEVYNYSSLNLTAGSSSNGYVGYYAKVVHTSNEETKIIKEDGMQYYKNDDGTYIALSPLYRSSIKEVNIKDGTTEINKYAFYYCKSLTRIEIPSSVTSIGYNAFQNCSSLTSIEIPSNITSISDSVFQNCSSLTSIEIPSNVKKIGISAFRDCSNLTSIKIPSSVTNIGAYAFNRCTNLNSLTFESVDNWEKSSDSSFTYNVTSNISLSNPSQNATWFKDTSGYYSYYWRKMA